MNQVASEKAKKTIGSVTHLLIPTLTSLSVIHLNVKYPSSLNS